MTQIEQLYLQYYEDISTAMLKDNAPFSVLTAKLIVEFTKLGLTNEEKAKALAAIYSEEIKYMDSEASKAALALLKQEDDGELNDAKIETEKRKRRGYDDNVLIEIMKAQGGLASFAVNANSDTAQDTIDDLHVVMDKVEDRVCDFVCDTPSFDILLTTTDGTPVDGDLYGGSGLTFVITEQPEVGSIEVFADGSFTYTTDGVGRFKAIITGTDENNGFAVANVVTIDVNSIAEIQ